MRTMATVASTNRTTYKDSPFVQWKLFPDFEKLVTHCKPEQAVPVFEDLIRAANDRFTELEKQFEPTWEGTMGRCKRS